MEDIEPFKGFSFDCGCPICADCFKNYAKIHVEKAQLLECGKCKKQVSSQRIGLVLDDENLKRYIEIEQIHMRKVLKMFNCLTPDCKNAVSLDPKATEPVTTTIDLLNAMGKEDLEKIAGIGRSRSRLILNRRPFRDWDHVIGCGIPAYVIQQIRLHQVVPKAEV
eukprot:UN32822